MKRLTAAVLTIVAALAVTGVALAGPAHMASSGTVVNTKKTSLGTQLWGAAGAGVWSTPALDFKRGVLYIATGAIGAVGAAARLSAWPAPRVALRGSSSLWRSPAFLPSSCSIRLSPETRRRR